MTRGLRGLSGFTDDLLDVPSLVLVVREAVKGVAAAGDHDDGGVDAAARGEAEGPGAADGHDLFVGRDEAFFAEDHAQVHHDLHALGESAEGVADAVGVGVGHFAGEPDGDSPGFQRGEDVLVEALPRGAHDV